MLWAILTTEAVRTAQGRFGKGQPMTGEQVRWGLENLKIDDARLKELGVAGFMQPLKVSCLDHEGGGAVKFQQWDGNEWKVITDWIPSDQSTRAPDDRGLGGAVCPGEGHHAARLREGRVSRGFAGSDCSGPAPCEPARLARRAVKEASGGPRRGG